MNHDLPPRPQVDPAEVAVIVAVAVAMSSLSPNHVVENDETPAWRFSGRWFNRGPFSLRRPSRLR
ncbi:MAG: hypothetical protein HKL86_03535 [Acidimicrobiaceae bacterium]|nr:hypothetical protein [Acidimicrobiaceae bacterium]